MTLVSDLSDPDRCAHLARNPSPQFYSALRIAIQQNSRAWLQRQMALFFLITSVLRGGVARMHKLGRARLVRWWNKRQNFPRGVQGGEEQRSQWG